MYRQLRARRALSIFKDVPFSTRRALLLYNFGGNSALLASTDGINPNHPRNADMTYWNIKSYYHHYLSHAIFYVVTSVTLKYNVKQNQPYCFRCFPLGNVDEVNTNTAISLLIRCNLSVLRDTRAYMATVRMTKNNVAANIFIYDNYAPCYFIHWKSWKAII